MKHKLQWLILLVLVGYFAGMGSTFAGDKEKGDKKHQKAEAEPSDAFTEVNNLIPIGNFEGPIYGWVGERKIIEQEGNKVLYVEVTERNAKTFGYTIRGLRGYNTCRLNFKIKAEKGYEGDGLSLRIEQDDFDYERSWSQNFRIKPDGEWHTIDWGFTGLKNATSVKMEFTVRKGTGKLYFDDFMATPTN